MKTKKTPKDTDKTTEEGKDIFAALGVSPDREIKSDIDTDADKAAADVYMLPRFTSFPAIITTSVLERHDDQAILNFEAEEVTRKSDVSDAWEPVTEDAPITAKPRFAGWAKLLRKDKKRKPQRHHLNENKMNRLLFIAGIVKATGTSYEKAATVYEEIKNDYSLMLRLSSKLIGLRVYVMKIKDGDAIAKDGSDTNYIDWIVSPVNEQLEAFDLASLFAIDDPEEREDLKRATAEWNPPTV